MTAPTTTYMRAREALRRLGHPVKDGCTGQAILCAIYTYQGKPKPAILELEYIVVQIEAWVRTQVPPAPLPVHQFSVFARRPLKRPAMQAAVARARGDIVRGRSIV
jgi:hypothetical protein